MIVFLKSAKVNGVKTYTWSLLKRMLKGTYVAVEPKHLDKYLDEECFRFNARKGTDGTRFRQVMRQVLGKRMVNDGNTAS